MTGKHSRGFFLELIFARMVYDSFHCITMKKIANL